MNGSKSKLLFMALISLMLALPTTNSHAQSEAAMLFLLINNSPISVAMGDCGINYVHEGSALSNPGAFGLFYLDHLGALSVPNSNAWLPSRYDDLSLASYSVSGRLAYWGATDKAEGPNYSLSLGFSRHKLNYGTIVRTDANGNSLGSFDSWEAASIITVGFGIENGYRIGIGASVKYVQSHLADWGAGQERGSGETSVTARDIGLIGEYPFELSLNSASDLALAITPSLAFVGDNYGPDVEYTGYAQSDPLPNRGRLGFSLELKLMSKKVSLLSVRAVYEKVADLIKETDKWIGKNRGLEFGLASALYYRLGKSHYMYRPWDDRYETRMGYGLRLRGLMALIWEPRESKGSSSPGDYLYDHLDISFDYAKITDDAGYTPFADTKFIRFALSF